MRKTITIVAALVMAASVSLFANSNIVEGMYDEAIKYELDTITGTTYFLVEELMDDQFAFYFNQDYCTNVIPFLRLEYEDDDMHEFISLIMSANGNEYRVDLHPAQGKHKKVGGGYLGVYDSFYQNNTALLVEAFDDPNLEIELYSGGDERIKLEFDYDLNKQIVDAYKNFARYKGYF